MSVKASGASTTVFIKSRIVVVGSNPSESSPDASPFHISTRSRIILDEWFTGMDADIWFTNVSHQKKMGNKPLTVKDIKDALPEFKDRMSGFKDCKVVALGNTAARALDMLDVKYFPMPHPSGLNRVLNDKELMAQKIKKLAEFISEPS